MELERTTTKTTPRTTRKATTTVKAASKAIVTGEQRQKMIAEAAYFRAEKRGFEGNGHLEDWISAEHEVDTLLSRIDELVRR